MAAEDGGKPLTHPRRRTPDHPPYAVMIAAAIQTSSEEGGSTVEAISRYIRSHYDDLPDGHDNLLPYYLSKLTAQGEFIMPEPGRFLVAACAGAKPAPGSRPYRAQPSPPSKPADEKDDDRGTAESPSAEGRDSDNSIESQNGEGSSKARPAESMLECSDEGNKESSEYVLGLPWEGPPVTATAIATANKGDGSDPVPKRGGRALKRKAASIGDSETEGLDQLKDGNDEPEPKRKKPRVGSAIATATANEGDGSDPVPKRGGRALKRKAASIGDAEPDDEPEPKRRGRPRKKKPVLIGNSGVGSETGGEGEEHGADGKGQEQPEPKRRGRPPKKKPVLIDNAGVGEGQDKKRAADGKAKVISSFLPSMSLFRLEYFRNSRLVEVATIFDTNQRTTGGGFLLRDEAHEPLLARAFPIAGGTFIFTEAVAVRQAIEEMLRLGEERLIICSSSMALLRCFHGSGATDSSAADGVVGECIELFRRAPRFHLVCVHEEELAAARCLAQTGAQSQQHIQWDKPLMDELSEKLKA